MGNDSSRIRDRGSDATCSNPNQSSASSSFHTASSNTPSGSSEFFSAVCSGNSHVNLDPDNGLSQKYFNTCWLPPCMKYWNCYLCLNGEQTTRMTQRSFLRLRKRMVRWLLKLGMQIPWTVSTTTRPTTTISYQLKDFLTKSKLYR